MRFGHLQAPRAQVYLLFYQPTAEDHWLNRLVALFDGPFSHVEIAFPERLGAMPWEKEIWGSSIYNGETVFYKPRQYARDGYVPIALELTLPQVIRLKHFCRTEAEAERPFCIKAMYAAYLPVQLMYTNATFCSKHVANALCAADVPEAHTLRPALCTPSSLYRFVTKSSAHAPILQVVPSRLRPENMASWSAQVVRDLVGWRSGSVADADSV